MKTGLLASSRKFFHKFLASMFYRAVYFSGRHLLMFVHAIFRRVPFQFQATCIRLSGYFFALLYMRKDMRYLESRGEKRFVTRYVYAYKRFVGRMEKHAWRFGRPSIKATNPRISGEEHLLKLLGKNQGILFVSVHHAYLPPAFYYLLERCSEMEPIIIKTPTEKEEMSFYSMYYYSILASNHTNFHQKAHTATRMVKHLLEGKAGIVLQDEMEKEQEEVPFFAKKRKLVLGSLRLAKLGKAIILPFTMGDEAGSFQKSKWNIHFLEPIDPNLPGAKEALLKSLEECINLYPPHYERWDTIL